MALSVISSLRCLKCESCNFLYGTSWQNVNLYTVPGCGIITGVTQPPWVRHDCKHMKSHIGVKDNYNCVADTFHFKVLPAASFSGSRNLPRWLWRFPSRNDFSLIIQLTGFDCNPSAGVNINSPTTQNPLHFSPKRFIPVTLVSATHLVRTPAYAGQMLLLIRFRPCSTIRPEQRSVRARAQHFQQPACPGYSWSSGSNTFRLVFPPLINTVYTNDALLQYLRDAARPQRR